MHEYAGVWPAAWSDETRRRCKRSGAVEVPFLWHKLTADAPRSADGISGQRSLYLCHDNNFSTAGKFSMKQCSPEMYRRVNSSDQCNRAQKTQALRWRGSQRASTDKPSAVLRLSVINCVKSCQSVAAPDMNSLKVAMARRHSWPPTI